MGTVSGYVYLHQTRARMDKKSQIWPLCMAFFIFNTKHWGPKSGTKNWPETSRDTQAEPHRNTCRITLAPQLQSRASR